MRGWVQDAAWVAGATVASRVLGLVREVVIADQFGASAAYDVYLIAFFIPHALRRLLAEGALSNAFVPLYAARLASQRDQADAFANTVLSAALVVFPLVIVAGILLAPWIVPWLADGFDPAQQALAVRLTRLTFPFLGLMGLAAVVAGVLNSHGKFGWPALAPAAFNLAVIVCVLGLRGLGTDALALGALLGGATQLLVQLPLLRGRLRFAWRPRWDDPGLRQLLRLLLPAALGLAVVQINVLVDNKLASRLPEGSISALQYAIRLFQLPMGVFVAAISTALLPRLAARRAPEAMLAQLRHGALLCAAILLPASVGLWLLARPTVALLFEHGAFSALDTIRTANALTFFSLGLLPYGLATVLVRAFYALEDGKTPVLLSAAAVGVNVALSLLLVGPMGVGGLALATSTAGWAQLALTWVALQRRLKRPLAAGLGQPLARIVSTTAAMGVVVWGMGQWLASWTHNELLLAAAPALAGALLYVALVWRALGQELGSAPFHSLKESSRPPQ